MTNYLLDTNHAGALLKRDAALRARLIAIGTDDTVRLCRPSVGELWYMVLNSARVSENRERLEGMLQALGVVEFDADAAEEYGSIRGGTPEGWASRTRGRCANCGHCEKTTLGVANL